MVAAFVAAAGCGMIKGKSALEFNDKLASCSDSLFTKGKRMGSEIGNAMKTHDFTAVTAMTNDLKQYIDKQLIEIEKLENVGGSDRLKEAMLQFLHFEKDLVGQAVMPFTKMNSSTPPEEIQTAVTTLMAKSSEENKYLEKVKTAQREYAQKNGFVIREATVPPPAQ